MLMAQVEMSSGGRIAAAQVQQHKAMRGIALRFFKGTFVGSRKQRVGKRLTTVTESSYAPPRCSLATGMHSSKPSQKVRSRPSV